MVFTRRGIMRIERAWAMPNKQTFSIKPVKNLIDYYAHGEVSVDPFSSTNTICKYRNDLDPNVGATHNLDALEFLKLFADESVDFLLFDPPYSPRQVSESYKKFGKTVNMETTQSSFWTKLKKEVARIMVKEGIVISFGWNSGGIGKKLGFDIKHILLVAHGGAHNDTICTVEQKR